MNQSLKDNSDLRDKRRSPEFEELLLSFPSPWSLPSLSSLIPPSSHQGFQS